MLSTVVSGQTWLLALPTFTIHSFTVASLQAGPKPLSNKHLSRAPAPSSYWTEEIDVHDDGTAETTEFLYDAQRGIVYAYGEDDFTCANGKPEKAGILEAVYTAGNKAGKPVGSGYYAVGLNAGQCAAKKAGAYGCRFDANGNPTECGAISRRARPAASPAT